jgi:hypothetical protein
MMQGKNYKRLRMLRAAGPLTAIFSGTLFVKLYHPDSISVVGLWSVFLHMLDFVFYVEVLMTTKAHVNNYLLMLLLC